MLQLLHEGYSITFPELSIARYSFIQLSELMPRGENENAQILKRWIQNRALSIASPEYYH